MSDPVSVPKKRRRISRACDFCNRRSIRCRPSQEDSDRCQNCVDFGVDCTYKRPMKRRGKPQQSTHSQLDESTGEHQELLPILPPTNLQKNHNAIYGASYESPRPRLEVKFSFELSEDHQEMVRNNLAKIQDLVTVYFEVVYPITRFPFFHRPTLLRKISTREYLSDKAQFAMTMAICALASARARDGALYPSKWNPDYLREPASELFSDAAKAVLPLDWSVMPCLDWMRTCAVLALVGIQLGNIKMMHQYLGIYHTLVAMDGLHDEKNWPKNIDMVEVEERRRLFWSIYTLEVYSSIVWGGMIRCREAQSRVQYPSELDDEMFSSTGIENHPSSPTTRQLNSFPMPVIADTSSWLRGWNFTTELYRILEHAMDEFHRRRPQSIGPLSPSDLFQQSAPPQSVVLDKIILMHDNLPARFKETRSVVGEMTADRYSFQAANISATLQLARMVLFTAEDATLEQKCVIARELLDDFANIPIFFLKAISSPLLHHLAGIGAILGSVIEGQLSLSEYFQVRTVLLRMADLLASLEVSLTQKAGASERLRTLLARIDQYMSTQHLQELPLAMPDVPQQQGVEWDGGAQRNFDGGSVPGMDASFQLPQELLVDWPWPLDLTQGFGNFRGI
ncbi:uncharacterized protein LY89DRAFT_770371 [Mollisia scopiformis]|uniref:Zn(2)-C6 fungal-type domain-containing protein n=1 Tax=Mollisia scopiformis TaxID=149040 RepID=A0A194XLL8_MOLSC|nr:uncharacterized protein LY89DRAFT_770371 [Mollisia scopiformis]KUJ21140.1 hypothetical protein LY89DRAFT_770371 [Mollisia scopiformis]